MNSTTKLPFTRLLYVYLLALFTIYPISSSAGEALNAFSRLGKAGLIVVGANGRSMMAERADLPLMPASTTKLATAWLALSRWGEGHRFQTDFIWDERSQTLWVKGSGDPYLVSEELELIARNLKQRGLRHVKAIGIDSSLFQPDLVLPGTGATDNPYDAVPTAVAANFNTVAVNRVGGRVVSAEQHTPLTPFAEKLANLRRSSELRVNTGPNPHDAEIYFGELLAAFLRENGVATGNQILFGQAPMQPVYYRHDNSKTLAEIVRAMLKYSTNFVANQLILMLSADAYKRPANAAVVQRYMEETLAKSFGWRDFSLADGAGLSRTNRLSPQQLTELLQAFSQWRHLLPEIEPGIYAKSGTLTGVSALAGYLVKGGEWRPFAVVMNESVPYHLRNRIAKELYSQ